MSWQSYIETVQGLGFTKVTIINRSNYKTVGYTAQMDIATAWQDGDTQVRDANDTIAWMSATRLFAATHTVYYNKSQVNENQELLDDWTDAKKKNI
eukprot:127862_1